MRELRDSHPDLYPSVYLIVDRVDRIRGVSQFYMSPLVTLIKESKIKLKVFLISSSNGYDGFGEKLWESLQDLGEDDQFRIRQVLGVGMEPVLFESGCASQSPAKKARQR